MRILSIVMFFCVALSLNAQQDIAWKQKIDTRLLERVFDGKKAEFLIILKEQADISYANQLRRKEDKGRYVYETLSNLAKSTQAPVRKMLDSLGAPWRNFWIVNGFWSIGTLNVIEQIAQMPEVERIEDNPIIHLTLEPRDATDVIDRTLTPVSWGLTKINADDVWLLGHKGLGVVVGGQDTGYEWQHPALKEKYRGWDGSVADHNYNWHDAIHSLINGSTPNSCGINLRHPCDDNGHGTHTMGTMAGSSSESNVIGVAPEAKWIGCRNMEEGDGTPATYIECFEWFIAPTDTLNGNPNPAMAPHVINNSWGCPTSEGCNSGNFITMDTAIQHVRASGILVVVSAGNDGASGCSSVNTPAAIYSSSFTVGATTNVSNDAIASYSSRGPVTVYGSIKKPDIAAPGSGIYSCYATDNNGSYQYATLSGTSMAGPHVAGVAALIMTARPDLKGQVATLESIMKNSAIPRYPTSGQLCGGDNTTTLPNNVYGYGRVDALAAVTAAIALPVELVDFQATKSNKTSLLDWETATESDCAAYEIERSTDGVQWSKIGAVACKGAGKYRFIDGAPGDGVVYYRLKQLDISGTYAYSKIVHVAFSASAYGMSLYINPQDDMLRIQAPDAEAAGETLWVMLVGADGRVYYEARFLHQLIDLSDKPAGLYVLVLKNEQGRVLAWGKLVK
ncbi:MAG: S8 family serine peptidase [Bacteroidota bacterium]